MNHDTESGRFLACLQIVGKEKRRLFAQTESEAVNLTGIKLF